MSKFACFCGFVISDSKYSCPCAGELRWEDETESQSAKTLTELKSFLSAFENGQGEEWTENYFGENYPTDTHLAEIIDDIYLKVSNEQGHSVLKCPECERLYLQKEFCTDDWTCFEKRQ